MEYLRIAYNALLEEECPDCRNSLRANQTHLSQDDNGNYSTQYTCPHCGSTTEFTITIDPPIVVVKPQNPKIGHIDNTRKLVASLVESGQRGSQEYDFAHYLNTSLTLVYQNLNRLFTWSERFPAIFEQVSGYTFTELDNRFEENLILDFERDNDWVALHTDVHNYLASVYSHHKFVEETIASILPSNADVDRLQTEYNSESKALLGLRHYAQHRMVTPLKVRLNNGSADRSVDILVGLDELRDFDYTDGFDYWFGDVEGGHVDVIDHGIQHYQKAGKHAIERIQTVREEYNDSFQEIENMQEEYPSLDEIDDFLGTDEE